MNECYLKPPNEYLLLVGLRSPSPGVFDSPVICDNGITEKKLSTKAWHCECAKQSFYFWSKCTFKGEIPQACVLERGLKCWYTWAFSWVEIYNHIPVARLWHSKLKSSPGTHVPPSSLKLTSCLLMLVHKFLKNSLSCFNFSFKLS